MLANVPVINRGLPSHTDQKVEMAVQMSEYCTPGIVATHHLIDEKDETVVDNVLTAIIA
jgi:hypothetical protein